MGRGNESLFIASGSNDQGGHHAPIWSSPAEPKGQWPWGLVCSIGDIGPTIFEKMIFG